MGKKRMIIVTSIILSVVVISLGIIKLYQTYALTNDIVDANSSPNIDINITENNAISVPANGYSNVFYMVSNTSPGAVRYGIGYSGTDVTVKVFSTSNDPASGLIEENGKKYVKLRLENSSSTSQSVVLSTVLGYSGDSNLLPPSGVTLVTEVHTPIPLAQYVTGLYTSGTKTTVKNNSITYNKVSSENLMNDRLGGTTADLDGGNIRYYGANPNNYVYFNCSSYPSTNCELWRIIGIFGGKTKIIRNESIGSLAWDQDKNIDSSKTTYDNDWSTASLQVLLNQKYYNGDTAGTATYYSGSSGGTSTSLDMSSIGIKNDATKNMISEETWNLGGWNSYSVFSDQIYGYERGTKVYGSNPTTWTGKIALPYPSDYGYATDFTKCSKNLYYYDSSADSYACRTNDWMYKNASWWLLTSNYANSNYAWRLYSTGYVSYNYAVYNKSEVVPVLYLDAGVLLEMGNGTESNPYKISGGSSSNLEQPIATYTISYNANNGTGAPSNQIKTQNVNLILSDTIPTRSGYKFMGWNTNSGGTGTSYASGSSYTENESVTLYAQWKQIFTITYDANNGTGAPGSQTKIAGEAITLSNTIPTRNDYEFDGWNTNSDGTGTTYASGATYSSDGDVILYAKWKLKVYTISYDNNGGSGCSTKSVVNNSQIGSLCTPSRTGYTFIGWYNSDYKDSPLNYYADTYSDLYNAFGYDADKLYNHYLTYGVNEGRRISQYISTDVYNYSSNKTIYAGWKRNIVTIKFSVNGGTLNSGSPYSVDSNGIVTKNGENLHKMYYNDTIISTGLPNYNNSSYLNISKTGYIGVSGAEWTCLSGNCVKSEYNQDNNEYKASDFCDASSSDCTITLGVNWEQVVNNYRCSTSDNNNYYYITTCNETTCKYTRNNCNRNTSGTISRSAITQCKATTINGERCDASLNNMYSITTCTAADCKYTSKNDTTTSGTVDRCDLTSCPTATFYPNGGAFSNGVSSYKISIRAGKNYYFSDINLPTLTRTNYTLDGWHDGSTSGTVFRQYFYITESGGNRSFYANWNYSGGGSSTSGSVSQCGSCNSNNDCYKPSSSTTVCDVQCVNSMCVWFGFKSGSTTICSTNGKACY